MLQIFTIKMILQVIKARTTPLPSTTPHADCRYSPDILQFHPSFLLSRPSSSGMYCCGGKAAERNPDHTAPAAAGFLLSLLGPLSHPLTTTLLSQHIHGSRHTSATAAHAIFYAGGIEPFFSGMRSSAPAETDTDGRNMPRQWDITVCGCLRAYRLFPVGCLQRFLCTPRHTCHLDRIGFSCARPLSDKLTGILYLLTLACCYGLLQICFAGFQTPVILRTEFKQHGGILRNRINRGSSLYFSYIVCCMRCCICLKTVKLSDRGPQALQ